VGEELKIYFFNSVFFILTLASGEVRSKITNKAELCVLPFIVN